MPTKESKKVAPVVEKVTPVEVDTEDFEDLDEETEEAAAEEKPKRKRAVKAKKEIPPGKNTKEVAAELGITPVKLRRILRTDDFVNDKEYTRYFLDDETIDRLKAAIAAGAGEKKTRGRKPKATAEAEAAEITEELEELESDEEEDLDFEEDEEEEAE